jgi:glycerophosphoryl diester phosphodiesterase
MTAQTGSIPGPLLIGHRGASAEAPENTIAAFELALTQGADGIELDVHLSKDGQPVVLHDFTLERTTTGAGMVGQHTVRELKRLDAGGWHGPQFRGQRVQTLQEVLERFRDRTRFWIALKGGSGVYAGIEERIVSVLEIYDVLERALVQSFDHRVLNQVRMLNPEVRVGALVAEPPIEPLLRSPKITDAICPCAQLMNEHTMVGIRDAGLDSYVWTVNEPAQMDRLVEWGVTGIITDRPGMLKAWLDR